MQITRAVIGRYPWWSIRVQTYRWRHGTLVHHQRLFRIRHVRPRKTLSRSCLQVTKFGQTKKKSFFNDLKMPKLEEIYTIVFIMCHGYETSSRVSCVTSVTHSCDTSLFLPHFNVICDLLLSRRTATRKLFFKHISGTNEINQFLFLLNNVLQ